MFKAITYMMIIIQILKKAKTILQSCSFIWILNTIT